MRQKWKQAGLILLGVLAVWLAYYVYMILVTSFTAASVVEVFIGLGALLFVLYLAAVKWIERRPPAELSVAGASRELGTGVLAGLALFALLMAILWVVGAYQLQGRGGSNALGVAVMAAFWLAVAIEEEILWRGLVYRLSAKVLGTGAGLLFSAVLFSAKHVLDNPNMTLAEAVVLLLAGLFFGAAYAATGRLWLPIGLHFGWNFAEGTLFGTNVSGVSVGATVMTGKLVGPSLLSGGASGPEASVVTWIILIAATAYLLWRTAKSKHIEAPIWRDVVAASTQGSAA